MPIKKVANQLNTEARVEDAVISVFTNSKKGHFSCSEAKLFESLEFSIGDTHKYYQVHLTTYPSIAVHITGDKDLIAKNCSDLRNAIVKTLNDLHDIGIVRIKKT
jgi:hypothetical protein